MFLKNSNELSREKKMKQLMTRNIEDESNHDNSIISIVIIFHATCFLCYANCINSKNFQQLVVLGVQIFWGVYVRQIFTHFEDMRLLVWKILLPEIGK